jgi:uncharacterized protein YxjI
MIELYIPHKKLTFNHHVDIIDENEQVLYHFGTSFFLGRLSLLKNGKVLYTANHKFNFLRIRTYEIYKNGEIVGKIKAKQFFNPCNYTVESDLGDFLVVGKPMIEKFDILDDNKLVLSVTSHMKKKYARIIEVDETQTEFLLMLMFTLIVAADYDSEP